MDADWDMTESEWAWTNTYHLCRWNQRYAPSITGKALKVINVQNYDDLALLNVTREPLPPMATNQEYYDCKHTAIELTKHLRHFGLHTSKIKSRRLAAILWATLRSTACTR